MEDAPLQPTSADPLAELIHIRPAVPADLAYITSAWSRAVYQHLERNAQQSHQFNKPTWRVFQRLFSLLMQNILTRADVRVLVSSEDPTQILSFAIVEQPLDSSPIVYWVQTKRDVWRRGLANRLLASWDITTKTPAYYAFPSTAFPIVRPAWEFVPFWLLTFNDQKLSA